MRPELLRPHGNSQLNRDAENLERRVATVVQDANGLSFALFDEVARWKLRGQYNRARRRQNDATVHAVAHVTKLALGEFPGIPEDQLLALRTRLLMSLPGVGLGVASAILGLAFPDLYCVIDYRGWRRVFPDHRHSQASFNPQGGSPQISFTLDHYQSYVAAVAGIAQELEWSVRKTDTAIWAYDEAQGE